MPIFVLTSDPDGGRIRGKLKICAKFSEKRIGAKKWLMIRRWRWLPAPGMSCRNLGKKHSGTCWSRTVFYWARRRQSGPDTTFPSRKRACESFFPIGGWCDLAVYKVALVYFIRVGSTRLGENTSTTVYKTVFETSNLFRFDYWRYSGLFDYSSWPVSARKYNGRNRLFGYIL